ncbi:ergothioneine biosynthesis glutamate--cysteine ligase EgtA [Pseudonocardia sp. WMMC193]|uniref:ergothioneine biosynthesis glutamate--cysteine ligase EgtA n=1 Tax=Pseudonocardia sp. WMMC193 TaxID=2911965 RepID=UPI001F01DBB6|nr:ergothioneine biosynthesis glutamate--cysteine ligase EgtA [Pseudonocardia sp. WMMC193]MCF7549056.1 ergothioneine biosynthesis glutamate--cysteine ligase EgtA [Pseudonocardia sp. WMMC193]
MAPEPGQALDAALSAQGTEPGEADLPLRTRAEAEAFVASVCFKHGPPRLVGVELEWLLRAADPPELTAILAGLGPHAPASLAPGSPAAPLPHGSLVTVEPGGQVELASPPLASLRALTAAVEEDTRSLHAGLAAYGLTPEPRAADPDRPARRLLDLPRYAAMERVFDRQGPYGRSGMCSTSAVQVALDAGERAHIAARWAAVHELGPVLLAAFANSPVLHGRRTGWKSSRFAAWLASDPARTAPPTDLDRPDPAQAWAERVVATPLLCVRGEGEWITPVGVTFADWIAGALPGTPTTADLEYHVSTLFPPVRPRGFLEVRYVDGQQGADWALPVAVLAALTARPATVDRVRELCEPVRDRWVQACRVGLEDPALAAAAREVFALAGAALPALDPPPALAARLAAVTEGRIAAGRSPADEPLPGEPTVPELVEIIPSRTEGARREPA